MAQEHKEETERRHYSQLSISRVQFCSSSGYLLRSIIHAAVVVILETYVMVICSSQGIVLEFFVRLGLIVTIIVRLLLFEPKLWPNCSCFASATVLKEVGCMHLYVLHVNIPHDGGNEDLRAKNNPDVPVLVETGLRSGVLWSEPIWDAT